MCITHQQLPTRTSTALCDGLGASVRLALCDGACCRFAVSLEFAALLLFLLAVATPQGSTRFATSRGMLVGYLATVTVVCIIAEVRLLLRCHVYAGGQCMWPSLQHAMRAA